MSIVVFCIPFVYCAQRHDAMMFSVINGPRYLSDILVFGKYPSTPLSYRWTHLDVLLELEVNVWYVACNLLSRELY